MPPTSSCACSRVATTWPILIGSTSASSGTGCLRPRVTSSKLVNLRGGHFLSDEPERSRRSAALGTDGARPLLRPARPPPWRLVPNTPGARVHLSQSSQSQASMRCARLVIRHMCLNSGTLALRLTVPSRCHHGRFPLWRGVHRGPLGNRGCPVSALSPADLPRLRGLREAYREQLRAAQRRRADANSLREKLASAADLVDLTRPSSTASARCSIASSDSPGCRGVAPALKGHGCPALALAVGPAATALPGSEAVRKGRDKRYITHPM